MNIEWAKFMSSDEKARYYKGFADNTRMQKNNAFVFLRANKALILKLYEAIENEAVEKYKLELEELNAKKESWKNKKCRECGAKLKLIKGTYGDFWGCENYLAPSENKHSNYDAKFSEVLENYTQNCKVRIHSNWATTIIRSARLNHIANTTDLLDFLQSIGVEDLRVKYLGRNTKESIAGFTKAKTQSKIEEKQLEDFLLKFYSKVLSQQHIIYKLTGEKQQRFCVLDLICSDETTVNIIEVKRQYYDIKLEQLNLYSSLIHYLQTKGNDPRKLQSLFVTFDTTESIKMTESLGLKKNTKHIVFNNLLKIKSSNEIKELFKNASIDFN